MWWERAKHPNFVDFLNGRAPKDRSALFMPRHKDDDPVFCSVLYWIVLVPVQGPWDCACPAIIRLSNFSPDAYSPSSPSFWQIILTTFFIVSTFTSQADLESVEAPHHSFAEPHVVDSCTTKVLPLSNPKHQTCHYGGNYKRRPNPRLPLFAVLSSLERSGEPWQALQLPPRRPRDLSDR